MADNLLRAYIVAYENAREQFLKMEISAIIEAARVKYDPENNCLIVRYIGRDFVVDIATGEITCPSSDKDVPVTDKVLIMHYLVEARISSPTGKLISFKELPHGGAIYCSNFQKRAIDPMVKRFNADFDMLYCVSEALGGRKTSLGHAAVTIDLLPNVPVTYVIWQGDDEVPSSGTILFDQNVDNYLPVEDIVVLASNGSYAMIGLAKSMS